MSGAPRIYRLEDTLLAHTLVALAEVAPDLARVVPAEVLVLGDRWSTFIPALLFLNAPYNAQAHHWSALAEVQPPFLWHTSWYAPLHVQGAVQGYCDARGWRWGVDAVSQELYGAHTSGRFRRTGPTPGHALAASLLDNLRALRVGR